MADENNDALAAQAEAIIVHWTKKQRFMIFCKRLRGRFRGDQLAIISFQYDSFGCN